MVQKITAVISSQLLVAHSNFRRMRCPFFNLQQKHEYFLGVCNTGSAEKCMGFPITSYGRTQTDFAELNMMQANLNAIYICLTNLRFYPVMSFFPQSCCPQMSQVCIHDSTWMTFFPASSLGPRTSHLLAPTEKHSASGHRAQELQKSEIWADFAAISLADCSVTLCC